MNSTRLDDMATQSWQVGSSFQPQHATAGHTRLSATQASASNNLSIQHSNSVSKSLLPPDAEASAPLTEGGISFEEEESK